MTSYDVLFLKYNIPETSSLKLMKYIHLYMWILCVSTSVYVSADRYECILHVYIMEVESIFPE